MDDKAFSSIWSSSVAYINNNILTVNVLTVLSIFPSGQRHQSVTYCSHIEPLRVTSYPYTTIIIIIITTSLDLFYKISKSCIDL